jgi:hypothetical protein
MTIETSERRAPMLHVGATGTNNNNNYVIKEISIYHVTLHWTAQEDFLSEVFWALTVNNSIFWVVMQCSQENEGEVFSF